MKNKLTILKTYICFFLLLFLTNSFSEQMKFEATKIENLDKNKLKATGDVSIENLNGLILSADQLFYDKEKLILEIEGNIIGFDEINQYTIKANKIIYYQLKDLLITIGQTKIETNKKYTIESSNIIYDRLTKNISTKEKAIAEDNLNNKFSFDGFSLSMKDKILKTKSANLIDSQLNKYNIEKLMFNLETNEIIGKDLDINFNNNLFNSKNNEPRLKGRAFSYKKDITSVKKSIFTTCQKRDGCPPWVMTAEEIKHDKKKKTINYKNAWLKVFDVPIVYFPKFFHPDPTVDRQSGFLIPKFSQSKKKGNYFEIPYFKVIADNIDLTFSPRFYDNNKTIYQTEYRHITENSEHIVDASIKNDSPLLLVKDNSSETHLFSNSKIKTNFDYFSESFFDMQIQQTSSDTYLKSYNINSPTVNTQSTLNSKITFEGFNDDVDFLFSTEIYEDLTKKTENDKFEYIFPNFNLTRNINNNFGGDLAFSTNGHKKLYDTNINEEVLINNISYKSLDDISKLGFVSNYEILFKNFNSNAKKSTQYKNENDHDLQSILNYQIKYPLKKLGDRFDSILSPIFSARYSPNKSKNIKNDDRLIDYNNIFSLNRIGTDETVEGGQSITFGNEFAIYDKNKNDIELFSLNLATSVRDQENDKLPINSSLNKEMSDIIGEMNIKTNEFIDFNYNFSVDNNVKDLNYHKISSKIKVNNFISSFEFLEKNNHLGQDSFISNETSYSFNEKNSFLFRTRKDKKTDLTEYYNLIYEYKMDCLVAGIEYKKDYYLDGSLKPEEQLFFSITIMPFGGSIYGPNVKQ
jgi:LPS-assembly protein